MAKKSTSGILYLVGALLTVVGFCCPMFSGLFGSSVNGFKFIDFSNKVSFVDIGACLLIVGAIVGLVWAVLPMVGVKLPSEALVKLIAVIVTIVGAIVLVIGFNQDSVYKALAKGFIKHALWGFWVCVAGLVVSIVGLIVKK